LSEFRKCAGLSYRTMSRKMEVCLLLPSEYLPQMHVGCFSAYSQRKHMLSKVKAVIGAGEVNRNTVPAYANMGESEDDIPGKWRVREAKVLQACELPAIYIQT
jgi:hypothetical protein